MSICIIDCVYSLRAKYESTKKKVVKRYANRFMNGNVNADTNQLTDFVNHIEDAGGRDLKVYIAAINESSMEASIIDNLMGTIDKLK